MAKNYYELLEVDTTATEGEIKKAYKKKAMQYHPDKNAGDTKAEAKFKEINEAYQTIGDKTKRQNYDQFGTADGGSFGGGMGGNPFGGKRSQARGSTGRSHSGGFDDIFSGFQGMGGGVEFDMGDMFGNGGAQSRTNSREEEPKKEIQNLDVTETVEIPFFDFLYDTSLSIKTVYAKVLTLKIKAGTKPGTKYKISGKGRTIDGKTGDMFVIVNAKMPTLPLDVTVEKMIEAIRYQI